MPVDAGRESQRRREDGEHHVVESVYCCAVVGCQWREWFISLRLNVPVEGHVQIAIRNQPSSYTRNPGWFGAAVFLEICIHQKVPAAVFVVFSHHVPCC
jgi:hypothetical protein